jgi:hypothetical protein
MRFSLVAAVLLVSLGGARAAEPTDLREFRVGMPAAALPQTGYTGFACADDPKIALADWRDWRRCPSDATGRHAVRFRYRDEATKVGGHPVLLTLLLAEPGEVVGLRIETDPEAPLYMRKKAFLLGLQARSRYGVDGWSCSEGHPSADARPIGATFVAEYCMKKVEDRRIIVERHLFRRPDAPLRDFVNETRISILQIP